MNVRFQSGLPWALAVSFARAIQQPALRFGKARRPTRWRPSMLCITGPSATWAARRGEYTAALEKT
jgi:fructose-bisphosphate aldolase class I